MPEFNVKLTTFAPVHLTLRMSAEDKAEAERKALEKVQNSNCRWQLNQDSLALTNRDSVHVVVEEV